MEQMKIGLMTNLTVGGLFSLAVFGRANEGGLIPQGEGGEKVSRCGGNGLAEHRRGGVILK